MKALGIQSDREIAELVCGDDEKLLDRLSPSFEESIKAKIYTQEQALEFIGGKVKMTQKVYRVGIKRNWAEEARELFATNVLAHIPVDEVNGQFNFLPKAMYMAVMIRRVLQALGDGGTVDDRDFVGNKRLEL
jgi:DNA-directed RNA polymerase III subunit RPC2